MPVVTNGATSVPGKGADATPEPGVIPLFQLSPSTSLPAHNLPVQSRHALDLRLSDILPPDHSIPPLSSPFCPRELSSAGGSKSMGNASSKSTPAPPIASPTLIAFKGQGSNVFSGSKLKRALTGRRKKSVDNARPQVKLTGKEVDSWQDQRPPADSRCGTVAVSSSLLSLSQTKTSTSSLNAQFKGARQLATQVFHMSNKKPLKSLPSPLDPPPMPSKAEPLLTDDMRSLPALPPPSNELNNSVPNNSTAITPIGPAMSLAVDPLSKGTGDSEGVVSAGSDDGKQKEPVERTNTKDSWRKSDSTIGHHTIRPGALANSRASRPVSMAESVQSMRTVVPASKRLSALVSDADFAMPEEDDEETRVGRNMNIAELYNASSGPSEFLKMRRSMSISLPPPPLHPPVGLPLLNGKPAYISISPEAAQGAASAPEWEPPPASAPAEISRDSSLPPFDSHAMGGGSLRGKLGIWPISSKESILLSSWKERGEPAPQDKAHRGPGLHLSTQGSTSFRQTAISMTSRLAPAAGLAKRAVEKMGRAWGISPTSSGSEYSSFMSSFSSPSFDSGSLITDNVLVRTNSNQSAPSIAAPPPSLQGKHRRTPHSGSHSLASVVTSGSTSDHDGGPNLGRLCRGPTRSRKVFPGTGKGVFGRDLKAVVRETRVHLESSQDEQYGDEYHKLRNQMRELESRQLPALVMRCAQHLLLWGVQEEGLFRLSGRPTHVNKLRAEFDLGTDYDMTECSPVDLDPHAVASVFKAYLRELPEPILTHTLLPYFDAAIDQETARHAQAGAPKSTHPLKKSPQRSDNTKFHAPLRKPPSLSTLAIPSFSDLPPPSLSLVTAFRSLVAQLPVENRDLVQTVVELIRATSKAVKMTKMPLSNLLLVFCPSLNMSPSLLRVLCDEVVWGATPEATTVIDAKRDAILLDRSHSDEDSDDDYMDAQEHLDDEASLTGTHNSADYHGPDEDALIPDQSDSKQRWNVVERRDVYLDSRCSLTTHTSGDSLRSDLVNAPGGSTQPILSDEDFSPSSTSSTCPPLLSSSSESVATPSSSGHMSFPHLPIDTLTKLTGSERTENTRHVPRPGIAEPASFALDSPITKRPFISDPLPIDKPIEFPTSPSQESAPLKRRSIPLLSLPVFALNANAIPHSPASSISSPRGLRTKKPSLRLLFQKRSTSSLSGVPGLKSSISGPVLPQDFLGQCHDPLRTRQDPSPVTPLSSLAPVIDTPIEGSSLQLGSAFESFPASTGTGGVPTDIAGLGVGGTGPAVREVLFPGNSGPTISRSPIPVRQHTSVGGAHPVSLFTKVTHLDDSDVAHVIEPAWSAGARTGRRLVENRLTSR